MTQTRFLKTAGIITAFTAIILAGTMTNSKRVNARDDDQTNESRIQRGFDIAPVPLNVKGKNRALVGLGSYIVNAVGDCNGCHSAGPRTEFANGGNPYFLSPAVYWEQTTQSVDLFRQRPGSRAVHRFATGSRCSHPSSDRLLVWECPIDSSFSRALRYSTDKRSYFARAIEQRAFALTINL